MSAVGGGGPPCSGFERAPTHGLCAAGRSCCALCVRLGLGTWRIATLGLGPHASLLTLAPSLVSPNPLSKELPVLAGGWRLCPGRHRWRHHRGVHLRPRQARMNAGRRAAGAPPWGRRACLPLAAAGREGLFVVQAASWGLPRRAAHGFRAPRAETRRSRVHQPPGASEAQRREGPALTHFWSGSCKFWARGATAPVAGADGVRVKQALTRFSLPRAANQIARIFCWNTFVNPVCCAALHRDCGRQAREAARRGRQLPCVETACDATLTRKACVAGYTSFCGSAAAAPLAPAPHAAAPAAWAPAGGGALGMCQPRRRWAPAPRRLALTAPPQRRPCRPNQRPRALRSGMGQEQLSMRFWTQRLPTQQGRLLRAATLLVCPAPHHLRHHRHWQRRCLRQRWQLPRQGSRPCGWRRCTSRKRSSPPRMRQRGACQAAARSGLRLTPGPGQPLQRQTLTGPSAARCAAAPPAAARRAR